MKILAIAALALVVAACSVRSEPSEAEPTAASVGRTCSLTLANRSTPADARDWKAANSYGNGKLWTLFWPQNVVIATPDFIQDDGAVRMKWPWWRGVKGPLRVTGRRIEATAPPLHAEVPSQYGRGGFQPTALVFPTVGCWRVTGTVGGSRLTFVTIVLKARRHSP